MVCLRQRKRARDPERARPQGLEGERQRLSRRGAVQAAAAQAQVRSAPRIVRSVARGRQRLAPPRARPATAARRVGLLPTLHGPNVLQVQCGLPRRRPREAAVGGRSVQVSLQGQPLLYDHLGCELGNHQAEQADESRQGVPRYLGMWVAEDAHHEERAQRHRRRGVCLPLDHPRPRRGVEVRVHDAVL